MISVIVPAYNAEDTLDACLQSLVQQSVRKEEYEIIVVDDGSSDSTSAVGGSYDVRMLWQAHQGPGAARNYGAKMARGDILLFTDADCVPDHRWVEEMVRGFADEDVVAAKGTYRTLQRQLVARFVQLEFADKYDRLQKQESIDFVDTYSAGYRRQVFLDNGGFDTSFARTSLEDQELSFRLAEKGYKMVFQPRAVVYHRHPDSVPGYARRKYWIGYYRVPVHKRHPQKVASDSRTPPSLRAQVMLLPLLALTGVAGFLQKELWYAFVGLLALLLLSTLPFTAKAALRDLPAAVVAPPLLVLRSVALAVGFVHGNVHFAGRMDGHSMTLLDRILKRFFDVVGALVLLILSAPLVPLIAVLIKLDSKGPMLFAQERVGENGRVFRMYKFRSMVENAPALLPIYVNLQSLEQPAFKVPNDPRVTRVGRVLRETSLDELPQLINVLLGDMSLVGPRPEEREVVKLYNAHHRRRLAMKPGLTGPMQINGRANLPLEKRIELEIAYIENYSVLQDLRILLHTIPTVLSREGAY